MGNGKPWNKKWSPPWLYFTQDLIQNSHTGSLLDLISVQEIWMSPNPLTATASYFQWLSKTNLDTKPISTKSTKPQWLAWAYWSDTHTMTRWICFAGYVYRKLLPEPAMHVRFVALNTCVCEPQRVMHFTFVAQWAEVVIFINQNKILRVSACTTIGLQSVVYGSLHNLPSLHEVLYTKGNCSR